MLLAKRRSRDLQRQAARIQAGHAAAATRATDTLTGWRTVQHAAAEADAYSRAVDQAHTAAVGAANIHALTVVVMEGWGNGSMLLVLAYGGHLVASRAVTPGQLAAFVMYALILAGNITGLSSMVLEFAKAVAAWERVLDILERVPQVPGPDWGNGIQEVEEVNESILEQNRYHRNHDQIRPLAVSFSNVSFAYPCRPERPILRQVSLDIAAGETVALVGASGSGKSTLATALLPRLYNIDTGSIAVDGVDIMSLRSPQALRRSIGVVEQEPLLFPTTLWENIRYGKRGASGAEVYAAAVAVRVWEFAQHWPEKLQTLVGPTVQLSGGQKQRVAIARCMLKNPPIVVLDEATSALDAESEHAVQQALDAACAGRTVLVVAHRLSSIQSADRIAVLHEGQVAECGTYQALVLQKGLFWQLFHRQLTDGPSEQNMIQ